MQHPDPIWQDANVYIIDTLLSIANGGKIPDVDGSGRRPSHRPDFIEDLIYIIESKDPQWFSDKLLAELFSNLSIKWYIDYAFVARFHDREWDWSLLSRNYAIDIIDIFSNPQHPWDFSSVSEHPGLTWDHVSKYSWLPWNYAKLSQHKCVTWDIVCANPQIAWDYELLRLNDNITDDIIRDNQDKLGINGDAGMVIFRLGSGIGHARLKYFRDTLTQTPENHEWSARTLELIKKYPDGPLNWLKISEDIVIDESTMERYMDYKWNWTVMSAHFSLAFYRKHMEARPWEWRLLSVNSNITWKDVRNNPDISHKWTRRHLFGNWMMQPRKRYDYPLYYSAHRQEQTKQYVAKIEEELMERAWHPRRVVDWCLSLDEKK